MAKLPRFYIPPGNIADKQIRLTPKVVGHAVKTLRLREGDKLVLFDGSGIEVEGTLQHDTHGAWTALIEKTFPGRPPLKPSLFLYQAPIKKERWEWLIEKAAELGVHAIVPLVTKHVDADVTKNFEKKRERWETILQSACEQCGGSILPKLLAPIPFKEAIASARGQRLLFYEGKAEPLKSILPKIKQDEEVSIFIGPVGGFSNEEIQFASESEVPIVSFGSQILRSETAGLAAISIISVVLQT